MMMSVTASEARSRLFPLIEQVNDDQVAVEIVSRHGTAFLAPPTNTAPCGKPRTASISGERPPPT